MSRMNKTDWDSRDRLIATKEPTRRVGQRAKEVTDIKVHIGPHAETPIIVRRRPVVSNAKPQRFVSLHHHSTFSYLDGYQLPEAHVRRMTELNMGSMAMTEHGNMDSHTQFERAAKKQGIKSILGVEIYMPATMRGEEETQRKHHLTLIARNAEGYRNLIRLVTLSNVPKAKGGPFFHEPTVTMSMLKRHKRGLICLSGCQGSLLACSTVGGKGIEEGEASYRRGLAVARMFKQIFGKWFFIEVQAFPELEKTRKFNALAGRLARAIGTKLVATMDCHYTLLEESEVQQILHNLRPGKKKTIEQQAREWGYEVPLCPPPNDRSIYRRLRATGLSKTEAIEAIVTTEEIGQECNVELPQLPMVEFPLPDGWTDKIEYWRHLLKEGWKFRGLDKLPAARRKEYSDPLKHEMNLIESKDFVNYFLLVQAGVRYIKEVHGIPVGPARGSAAASIAAFCLRITEVDPLRIDFGGLLRFERFIDESREDLPDIDLDFPSRARPLLRAFYENMFGGSQYVTNVGTFIYFRNKIALDDVARVFHVPKWEVEKVKSYLIERSSADLRASSTVEDTLAQFPAAAEVVERHPNLTKAALLEGGVKGFGVHAAALVLSNEPITTVTPLIEREVPKGSGNIVQVVGLDKHDAEYRGLLKMDFLGLNTMSMIEDIITHPLVNMTIDELYNLPLDDPKVYDRFVNNDVVGVFQWDGRATRFVNGAVKPTFFRELMDINALSRPGPLHGGSTREYIETKHGRQAPESLHPALDILTAPTHYQIVYQEQILSILRQVGNFPWGVTAEVRKIISKKQGEQAFNQKHAQFMEGVSTVHERMDVPRMDEETGNKIWRRMITAGSYCISGDTVVYRGSSNETEGREITVRELYKRIHGHLPPTTSVGAQNAPVKYSDELVEEIRNRYSTENISQRELARQYGVGQVFVNLVVNNKRRVGRAEYRSYRGPCVVCGCAREPMKNGKYPSRGLCVTCMSWRGQYSRRGLTLLQLGTDDHIRPGRMKDIVATGRQKVFLITTSGGKTIKATKNHRFLTSEGYKKVSELRVGCMIAVMGGRHEHKITERPPTPHNIRSLALKRSRNRCEECGLKRTSSNHSLEISHVETFEQMNEENSKYNSLENIRVLCNSCHKQFDYDNGQRHSRDTNGRKLEYERMISKKYVGIEDTYDIEMDTPTHNFVANGIVTHNSFNASHCASYSLIAFYCMHFKIYHPSVFYYSALKHLSEDKRKELIRDAETHGIQIRPPHLKHSRKTWWTNNRRYVRAGFEQVYGIGVKTAPVICAERRRKPFNTWNDLLRIKGIGPKTVTKIRSFAEKDDPFEVYKLERNIAAVKQELQRGKLGALPIPTHSGATLDADQGKEMKVVWLGTITQRNVRDLFEYTYSKTGEELDPAQVKDPELREWVVCRGEDDTEPVMLKINRWKYPKFKQAVMGARMEEDLVLVQGRRPKFAGTRQINLDNMWVIELDKEEDQPDGGSQRVSKSNKQRKKGDRLHGKGNAKARPEGARSRPRKLVQTT